MSHLTEQVGGGKPNQFLMVNSLQQLCATRPKHRMRLRMRLDSYLSTSPQRAEKILDSRGGEFGPSLAIVFYRQAEQMAARFCDSPASGTRDLRNQLAVVQAFD